MGSGNVSMTFGIVVYRRIIIIIIIVCSSRTPTSHSISHPPPAFVLAAHSINELHEDSKRAYYARFHFWFTIKKHTHTRMREIPLVYPRLKEENRKKENWK